MCPKKSGQSPAIPIEAPIAETKMHFAKAGSQKIPFETYPCAIRVDKVLHPSSDQSPHDFLILEFELPKYVLP